MLYRILKITDLKDVVNTHYSTRATNSQGIFATLGKPFLAQYYKIVLEDKYSIVLGAEGDDGKIHGICFAILDSEKHDKNLRKHKVRLVLGALSSIVRKPRVLKDLFERYKSLKSGDDKYVLNTGARMGFWGWSPHYKNPTGAIGLLQTCLLVMRDIGLNDLFLEVDNFNKVSYQVHFFLGAKLISEMTLPDGRARSILKYDLSNINIRD